MKKTLVVSIFGGPGVGKSTTAAYLFSLLKIEGVNVELVTEYAKKLTWTESWKTLKNQLYIFAKQHHIMWAIKDHVDVIITDAPLINSIIYGNKEDEKLNELILSEHNKYENFNVLLKRANFYDAVGRYQDEIEAKNVDNRVENVLNELKIDFYTHDINKDIVSIGTEIFKKLNELRENQQ